jgi:hypothetical protein
MDEESRRAVEAARGLLSQGRVVEALKVVLALLRRMGKNDAADALAARQQEQAGAQQQQTQLQQPLSAADLARLLEQVSLERTAAPQAQAPVDGTDGAPSLLSERGQGGIAAGAMADGSSVRCSGCGGVIAARRMAQHSAWCSAAATGAEKEKEEEDGGAREMEE